jgi:outer membrane immunogenic protein
MIRKTIAAVAALLATTTMASAADMAVKAAPVLPPVVWSWTGFYIGAHVGAGFGETESTITTAAPVVSLPFSQNSRSGFLGGGQIGYNWQAGWAVFGVQADIAGMNVKGTTPCGVVINLFTCSSESQWLATVSGRLGAVVLDRGLVYVKGGGAWLNTDHDVTLPFTAPATNITSLNSTTWGWLVGLGTEWMITPNWTAFIEYNYIQFDTKNETFTINPLIAGPGATVRADLTNTLSIAKVGVNYKFNWGAARY